jgi:hypothetical protein
MGNGKIYCKESGGYPVKRLTRGADTTSYVFCSKELLAVITKTDTGRLMLSFLTPNDSEYYSHATKADLLLRALRHHHTRHSGRAGGGGGRKIGAGTGRSGRFPFLVC